jgi:hypothetical protein
MRRTPRVDRENATHMAARLTKKAEAQLRTHLAASSHDDLVDIVLEQAGRDASLKDRLLVDASRSAGQPRSMSHRFVAR